MVIKCPTCSKRVRNLVKLNRHHEWCRGHPRIGAGFGRKRRRVEENNYDIDGSAIDKNIVIPIVDTYSYYEDDYMREEDGNRVDDDNNYLGMIV